VRHYLAWIVSPKRRRAVLNIAALASASHHDRLLQPRRIGKTKLVTSRNLHQPEQLCSNAIRHPIGDHCGNHASDASFPRKSRVAGQSLRVKARTSAPRHSPPRLDRLRNPQLAGRIAAAPSPERTLPLFLLFLQQIISWRRAFAAEILDFQRRDAWQEQRITAGHDAEIRCKVTNTPRLEDAFLLLYEIKYCNNSMIFLILSIKFEFLAVRHAP